MRRFLLLAVGVILAAQVPGAGAPLPFPKPVPRTGLPVGKWKVVFANGVIEECRVGRGGDAFVEEPLRRSAGRAVDNGGSVVITFTDDRVERWTPAGTTRLVVEHWFPGSAFPNRTPVLGTAERAR
jgi:hypothetical protein